MPMRWIAGSFQLRASRKFMGLYGTGGRIGEFPDRIPAAVRAPNLSRWPVPRRDQSFEAGCNTWLHRSQKPLTNSASSA
jgi:hypothetical protein